MGGKSDVNIVIQTVWKAVADCNPLLLRGGKDDTISISISQKVKVVITVREVKEAYSHGR